MTKILIIDDDAVVLKSFEEALKPEGYILSFCSSTIEALRILESERFEVIITELKLQKLDGQKFLNILIEKKKVLPCPVVITSNAIESEFINAFGNNSLIHFMPKPVSANELKDKIKSIVVKDQKLKVIDVRFINPILHAAVETIAQMTKLEVSHVKTYIKRPKEISGDITGLVGVIGSGFKGTISLSFVKSIFLIVVSKMLNEDIKEIDDDNKDAVAELINIIFGKAKKELNEGGLNIQPALPTIIQGKKHIIAHSNQNKTIVILFNCAEVGEFRIEISSMS